MNAPPIDEARLPALRRRMVWTLFAVSALSTTGYIAAVTAGTLVAAEIAGSASVGGLPTTTTTLGTAAAASLLSLLMVRYGRRPGMLAGIARVERARLKCANHLTAETRRPLQRASYRSPVTAKATSLPYPDTSGSSSGPAPCWSDSPSAPGS